jgi:L-idonate 5-dehydrogenase
MKACVLHKIHDLRYEDHPDPVIKDPHEAVVRVLRGGICGTDAHYYDEGGIGTVIRVREPLIIGHEGVGVV